MTDNGHSEQGLGMGEAPIRQALISLKIVQELTWFSP